MKYSPHILLILSILTLSFTGTAQIAQGSFFSHDMQIKLPDADHIAPWELNNKKISLESGNQIRLIPPDMALINPNRIQRIQTDTLGSVSGPASCISTCLLDTFFVGKYLFLTDVRVEVPFFEDGTYEGESSMGWNILQEIADVQAPQNTGIGGVLTLQNVNSGNLTLSGKIRALAKINLSSLQGFPFQAGDIEEIRLIKCNTSPEVQQNIYYLEDMLNQEPTFCQFPSVDPQVAPVSAIARISNPVTVRYFHSLHEERASTLAQAISWLFSIPVRDIFVEDMQPYYNGNPPVKDYLEVWFN